MNSAWVLNQTVPKDPYSGAQGGRILGPLASAGYAVVHRLKIQTF